MKRPTRCDKRPIPLSDSLHRQLSAYALAASAAGVGILALAEPAEAKIVYTKTHKVIGQHGLHAYGFDLNHDGINDFTLTWEKLSQTYRLLLQVSGFASSKQVVGNGSAQALQAGSTIGAKRPFWSGFLMIEAKGSRKSDYTSFSGGWVNSQHVQNGYLGFRFPIKGKTHYGWARCTVRTSTEGATTILHGYAYETVANKAIIAGKTHGANDKSVAQKNSASPNAPEPASLGRLAQGASGQQAWRHESTAAAR
jgi:hypothetical protein